jgi:hypothetical protein
MHGGRGQNKNGRNVLKADESGWKTYETSPENVFLSYTYKWIKTSDNQRFRGKASLSNIVNNINYKWHLQMGEIG